MQYRDLWNIFSKENLASIKNDFVIFLHETKLQFMQPELLLSIASFNKGSIDVNAA